MHELNLTFETTLIAMGLTLLAGLSTGIGSLMAFLAKATNKKFLSGTLGLSAGVMLYVSFMEMLPESLVQMESIYPGKLHIIYVVLSFFGGMGLIALIDFLIPEDENPHEPQNVERMADENRLSAMPTTNEHHRLKRTGMTLALAIGIHNFPEGVATFVSALNGLDVAIPIVVAIAIHNIPEGIAVSVPIYHATGNRKHALVYSLLSGLAEPLGALLALAFLIPFWTPLLSSVLLAAVAGIMVFISLDELLPGAERYGHHHYAITGVCAGMALMAFSLLLF